MAMLLPAFPKAFPSPLWIGCELPQQELDERSLWKDVNSVLATFVHFDFIWAHQKVSSIERPSFLQRQARHITAFYARLQRRHLTISSNFSVEISSSYSFTKG